MILPAIGCTTQCLRYDLNILEGATSTRSSRSGRILDPAESEEKFYWNKELRKSLKSFLVEKYINFRRIPSTQSIKLHTSFCPEDGPEIGPKYRLRGSSLWRNKDFRNLIKRSATPVIEAVPSSCPCNHPLCHKWQCDTARHRLHNTVLVICLKYFGGNYLYRIP